MRLCRVRHRPRGAHGQQLAEGVKVGTKSSTLGSRYLAVVLQLILQSGEGGRDSLAFVVPVGVRLFRRGSVHVVDGSRLDALL